MSNLQVRGSDGWMQFGIKSFLTALPYIIMLATFMVTTLYSLDKRVSMNEKATQGNSEKIDKLVMIVERLPLIDHTTQLHSEAIKSITRALEKITSNETEIRVQSAWKKSQEEANRRIEAALGRVYKRLAELERPR